MRILWICPTLLRPTINGSQIRTLGILRHLSRCHEIHFVGTARRDQTTERWEEYCARLYSFPHHPPTRGSLAFAGGALANLFSTTPLYVSRYASRPALHCVEWLLHENAYDSIIVDFLLSVPNLPRAWLPRSILFQHNVEALIMTRLAENASAGPRKAYLSYMGRRLEKYEREACLTAKHVITVSPADSAHLGSHYSVKSTAIATGVDVVHFEQPPALATGGIQSDLIFVGSMDYLPNVEGAHWFVANILPLIHAARPSTTVTFVGKYPVDSIRSLSTKDPRIRVTGTVPDIRPFLWKAQISIVPLLAGSGTRLKIYEAMAAGVPIISTSVGAEGLIYHEGVDILLADKPAEFAASCLALLADPGRRRAVGDAGQALVKSRFDWQAVAMQFQGVLERFR